MIVIVTGCLGFIGREVARQLLIDGHWVYGIDKVTYAADPDAEFQLSEYAYNFHSNFKLIKEDIATIKHIPDVDAIINIAAETHVDNSILDPEKFIHSNLIGVRNLLDLTRTKRLYEIPKFIQISTDEVYGDIEEGKLSKETDKLFPSSPYSASKASADLLIFSYARTFGIKYNIIRPSNCYGTYQYPEKLIPKTVRSLKMNRPIPIHGDGSQTRTWINVSDVADAIRTILYHGIENEIYNIGGYTSSVRDVVKKLVECHNSGDNWESYCQFDYKRAGIDLHYKVDDTKLRSLNWYPSVLLENELPNLYEHFFNSERF